MEYFSHLIQEKFLLPLKSKNEIQYFEKVNYNFYEPNKLSNAILNIDTNTSERLIKKIIKNLESVGIFAIEIRVNNSGKIIDLLNNFNKTNIDSIDLVFDLNTDKNYLDSGFYENLLYAYERVTSITIFNVRWESLTKRKHGKLFKVISNYNDNMICGEISQKKFVANFYSLTEALKHNSCLNRKISIDAVGNIRNCPSMTESFGNIKDITLEEALEKPGFRKFWDINKDKIHVCKDCEFRYICTDCRAYVENPEDIFSKPLKCGYNPYTGEWSDWSANPLNQKIINFYDF